MGVLLGGFGQAWNFRRQRRGARFPRTLQSGSSFGRESRRRSLFQKRGGLYQVECAFALVVFIQARPGVFHDRSRGGAGIRWIFKAYKMLLRS